MRGRVVDVWLENLQPNRASKRTARSTTFKVKGAFYLTVEICGHNTTAGFGVASRIATIMILGRELANP